MSKKYLIRLFVITCLCTVSLLIKSEDKKCTVHSLVSKSDLSILVKKTNPVAINDDIITYYGFYSKF